MLFVSRYIEMRESLRTLAREHKPDKVGLEYPVFSAMYSAGMYGLFLYTCEALYTEGHDVVFWSPLQAKAHARDSLERPKGWVMMKPDMVEAAKADTGFKGTWNHNEADAYLIARLSGRFWEFLAGTIPEEALTKTERKYFTEVKTFERGKRVGETVQRGVMYREDERFFMWSQLEVGAPNGDESSSAESGGEGTTEDGEAGTGPGSRQEDPEE